MIPVLSSLFGGFMFMLFGFMSIFMLVMCLAGAFAAMFCGGISIARNSIRAASSAVKSFALPKQQKKRCQKQRNHWARYRQFQRRHLPYCFMQWCHTRQFDLAGGEEDTWHSLAVVGFTLNGRQKWDCHRAFPIGVSNSAWLIWTLDPLAPCSASSKSVSNSFLAAIVLDQSRWASKQNTQTCEITIAWGKSTLGQTHVCWASFQLFVETMRSFTQSISIEEPLQNVSSDSIRSLILVPKHENVRLHTLKNN